MNSEKNGIVVGLFIGVGGLSAMIDLLVSWTGSFNLTQQLTAHDQQIILFQLHCNLPVFQTTT